MRKLKAGAATLAVAAVAMAPAGIAVAANFHAGQHGNHCGIPKPSTPANGSGGLKVGQNCGVGHAGSHP